MRKREHLFCGHDLVLLNSDGEVISNSDDDLTVGYEVYEWEEEWAGYHSLGDPSLKGIDPADKLRVMLGAAQGLDELNRAGFSYKGKLLPDDVVVFVGVDQRPAVAKVKPPFETSMRPNSRYTAPETISPAPGATTHISSDIYCLGMAFLEFVLGQTLEDSQVLSLRKGGGLATISHPLVKELQIVLGIIGEMLAHDPQRRITLSDLIQKLETVLNYLMLAERYQVERATGQVDRDDLIQEDSLVSKQMQALLEFRGKEQTNPGGCLLTAQNITRQFVMALICERCQNQRGKGKKPGKEYNVGCHEDSSVLGKKKENPDFLICNLPSSHLRVPTTKFLELQSVSNELRAYVRKANKVIQISTSRRGNPRASEAREALDLAIDIVKWWKPGKAAS